MRKNRVSRIASGLTLLLAILAACAPRTQPGSLARETVTVFAAASLTESFTEMGRQFEAAHPGVTVQFNFAGSQQLRSQLEAGARADVFAPANMKEMNAAIAASLVVSGTQQAFAANRLVVITPRGNPGRLTELTGLARPGLKLVVADKAVPVGQYTLDMLAKMSGDPAYGAGFGARVGANMVSFEQDVKSVLAKVRLGEADAGVVYATDATAAGEEVSTLAVPDAFNQPVTYPIAALAQASHPALAQQFVGYVLSPTGREVLQRYGFTTLP